ncbi:MAG: Hsp20/alpha crystallin family protein [Myxococcales bacterium]|nr:Hsp20/alpha crystallin family protein [Myxococcales bacterium]
MTVLRWNPWVDAFSLHAEINRVFNGTAGEQGPRHQPRTQNFAPAVDIVEQADKFILKFDLPEIQAADVDISIENQILTVKGERKSEAPETKSGWQRLERNYGKFSRSFTLPNNVDADSIAAAAKDGVLRLELPKKAESQARKVAVTQLG